MRQSDQDSFSELGVSRRFTSRAVSFFAQIQRQGEGRVGHSNPTRVPSSQLSPQSRIDFTIGNSALPFSVS